MSFVLREPAGKYFTNPSFLSWGLTDNVDEAARFDTFEEADEMRRIVEKAVHSTYWDYSDVIPIPRVSPIK